MVFLGILPEGLLEIYNAANSWNPTNERKINVANSGCSPTRSISAIRRLLTESDESLQSPPKVPAAWAAAGTPPWDRPPHNPRTAHPATPLGASRLRLHARRGDTCLGGHIRESPPRHRGASHGLGTGVP